MFMFMFVELWISKAKLKSTNPCQFCCDSFNSTGNSLHWMLEQGCWDLFPFGLEGFGEVRHWYWGDGSLAHSLSQRYSVGFTSGLCEDQSSCFTPHSLNSLWNSISYLDETVCSLPVVLCFFPSREQHHREECVSQHCMKSVWLTVHMCRPALTEVLLTYLGNETPTRTDEFI